MLKNSTSCDLTIKQRVKFACSITGITMKELGAHMGMSPSSFSIRLNNGKFTKKELEDMANIIGCQYVSYFKFHDKADFNASDIGSQIKDALNHAGISVSELGRRIGVTHSAISKRIRIGKFTQDDLKGIAEHMGCTYISEFQFKNGIVI